MKKIDYANSYRYEYIRQVVIYSHTNDHLLLSTSALDGTCLNNCLFNTPLKKTVHNILNNKKTDGQFMNYTSSKIGKHF